MLISLATHGILCKPLCSTSTVIDLGAHHGAFAVAVRARFGSRVIAVEPTSRLATELRKLPDIEVVQAAIANTNGCATLQLDQNPQASSIRSLPHHSALGSEQVRTVTFATLLKEHKVTTVDLLKVDIEGSEVELINSMDDALLRCINQITIELHDFNGMITTDEANLIEKRLLSAGFSRICLSRTNRENLLFYRPSECRFSWREDLWARFVSRNVIGLRRWVNRHNVNFTRG